MRRALSEIRFDEVKAFWNEIRVLRPNKRASRSGIYNWTETETTRKSNTLQYNLRIPFGALHYKCVLIALRIASMHVCVLSICSYSPFPGRNEHGRIIQSVFAGRWTTFRSRLQNCTRSLFPQFKRNIYPIKNSLILILASIELESLSLLLRTKLNCVAFTIQSLIFLSPSAFVSDLHERDTLSGDGN